jgi:glutamate dehydrogenase
LAGKLYLGKDANTARVMDSLEEKNFIPTEFVESETKWFYNELGIDDMYFQTETTEA